MILRDMYCPKCGATQEDIALSSIETKQYVTNCKECTFFGGFEIVVNGGMKSRFRFMDWPEDPEFYRGQVKALDVTAKDSKGEDVRRYHSGSRTIGDKMHDNPKYHNGTEERETRRDKLKHKTRRERGTLPLLFDQKGKRIKRDAIKRCHADRSG